MLETSSSQEEKAMAVKKEVIHHSNKLP